MIITRKIRHVIRLKKLTLLKRLEIDLTAPEQELKMKDTEVSKQPIIPTEIKQLLTEKTKGT